MAKFLTDLTVTKIKTGQWELAGELKYESDIVEDLICVPAGTRTDFASVPRLPLAYLLAGNTAHRPAAVHDWLYSKQMYEKKIADKIFLEAMKVVGINWFRRKTMYFAVRLGGFKAWNSYKK